MKRFGPQKVAPRNELKRLDPTQSAQFSPSVRGVSRLHREKRFRWRFGCSALGPRRHQAGLYSFDPHGEILHRFTKLDRAALSGSHGLAQEQSKGGLCSARSGAVGRRTVPVDELRHG